MTSPTTPEDVEAFVVLMTVVQSLDVVPPGPPNMLTISRSICAASLVSPASDRQKAGISS
jgi:hypothetical protein